MSQEKKACCKHEDIFEIMYGLENFTAFFENLILIKKYYQDILIKLKEQRTLTNQEMEIIIKKLEMHEKCFCIDLKTACTHINTYLTMSRDGENTNDALIYTLDWLRDFSNASNLANSEIYSMILSMGFEELHLYSVFLPPYKNMSRVPFADNYFEKVLRNFEISFNRCKWFVVYQIQKDSCVACNGSFCRYLCHEEQSEIIDKIQSDMMKAGLIA